MKTLTTLAAAALIVGASSAHAGENYTAADLVKDCRDTGKKASCITYVAGAWATFFELAYYHPLAGLPGPNTDHIISNICVPANRIAQITPADLISFAEQAIEKDGSLPASPAAKALLAGLRLKFNCFERR